MPKSKENPIKIKTIQAQYEIVSYGEAHILHRKLTCYEGSRGTVYYTDGVFKATKEEMSGIWKDMRKHPKFSHSSKEQELPLKDITDIWTKQLRPNVEGIKDPRQQELDKLYNKEVKAVIKDIRAIA